MICSQFTQTCSDNNYKIMYLKKLFFVISVTIIFTGLPSYADPLFDVARMLRIQGRPDLALQHLDQLARSQPDNAIYRFERGVALAELGWCGQARRDFHRTLSLAPNRHSQVAVDQALRDLCPTRPNTWERALDVRLIADGNYNNATSVSSIFLGPFEFTLDPSARAQERYGVGANAHLGYSIGINERLAIVPSIGLGFLTLNDSVDSRLNFAPGLALDWRGDRWGGRIGPVLRMEQSTDGRVSRGYALEGRATRQVGPRNALAFTAAWGRLKHRNQLDTGTRLYGEAAWIHQVALSSWIRVSLSHSIAKRKPDFRTERNTRLMLAYSTQMHADYGLEVAGSIAKIRADAHHPMFGRTRLDTLTSLSVGVPFQAIETPFGHPVLGVSHTWARTNIALYEYNKTNGFIAFARSF